MRSFESLGDQFPENLILSHDLLEGCYARAALVSDVQLYESSPPRYLADVSRRHRWVRGDWQISPWLLPRVPGPAGRRLDNPISALSRWKIFDNLRRSLVAPALVLGADRGVVGAEPALVLDSRRGRDQPVPAALALGDGGLALAGRPYDRLAPPRSVALDRTRPGPDRADAGLPAVRGLLEPGCHRADGRADESDAHPPSGMDDFERGLRGPPRGPARRHRPGDGDRTGARGRARRRARIFEAGGTGHGNALARACGSSRRSSHGGSAGQPPEQRHG